MYVTCQLIHHSCVHSQRALSSLRDIGVWDILWYTSHMFLFTQCCQHSQMWHWMYVTCQLIHHFCVHSQRALSSPRDVALGVTCQLIHYFCVHSQRVLASLRDGALDVHDMASDPPFLCSFLTGCCHHSVQREGSGCLGNVHHHRPPLVHPGDQLRPLGEAALPWWPPHACQPLHAEHDQKGRVFELLVVVVVVKCSPAMHSRRHLLYAVVHQQMWPLGWELHVWPICFITPPHRQPHTVFRGFFSISVGRMVLCKECITAEDGPRVTMQWINLKQRMYLWWSLCPLYLYACQMRVTVGDSGFCCCTCITYFEC